MRVRAINFIDIQSAGDIISIGCYDSNGNLTSKTDTSETIGMSYDHLNMMSQFTNSSDSARTGVYSNSDTGLARLQKTIDPNGTPVTRKYVFDGEDVIGYYDGDTARKEFLTPFLDENLTMEISGDAGIYFYFHDGLGSVVNVARFYKDGETWTWDKAKTNRYVYYAFGAKRGGKYDIDGDGDCDVNDPYKKWGSREPLNTLYETWEPVNQDFEYTGRRFDDESETQESRARQLDLLTGRWLQMDPIGSYGGINYYLFVLNNPVLLVDRSGLCARWEPPYREEEREHARDSAKKQAKLWEEDKGYEADKNYKNKKWSIEELSTYEYALLAFGDSLFLGYALNEGASIDLVIGDVSEKGGRRGHCSKPDENNHMTITINMDEIEKDAKKAGKHYARCKFALTLSIVLHETVHANDFMDERLKQYRRVLVSASGQRLINKGGDRYKFNILTETRAFGMQIEWGKSHGLQYCCPETIKQIYSHGKDYYSDLEEHSGIESSIIKGYAWMYQNKRFDNNYDALKKASKKLHGKK